MTVYRTSRAFTLIELMIVLAVVGVVCVYNGRNREHATQEAQRYVAALADAGVDVRFVGCMDHDTDGDGYLACTIAVDGQPQTIDCAGDALVMENHGCKAYVAKIRVDNSTNVIDGGSTQTSAPRGRR
jgi:prepilin-type N-terminal cleavage/methylation domain-containing protein